MLARHHTVFAVGAFILYKAAIGQDLTGQPLEYGIVIFASLLPDIDEPGSYIGTRFSILAWPIKLAFGHREITHTTLMALFLTGIIYWILPSIAIPFFIGYFSHIFADFFFNSGVPMLYPLKRGRQRFWFVFQTGSWAEYAVMTVFSLALFAVLLIYQASFILNQIGQTDPELYSIISQFLAKFDLNDKLNTL